MQENLPDYLLIILVNSHLVEKENAEKKDRKKSKIKMLNTNKIENKMSKNEGESVRVTPLYPHVCY